MTAAARSIARANARRVVALKLIVMRFAELAERLGLRFSASKAHLEEVLDRAMVDDKLIRGVEFVFLRPSGALFVHVLLETNWRLHAALVDKAGRDSIDIPIDRGQLIQDVLSPALNDVIWYLERRFRAEGVNALKWYITWREDSRDDSQVRIRASRVAEELGFVPLTIGDHELLRQAHARREVVGAPTLLSEAGITIREF